MDAGASLAAIKRAKQAELIRTVARGWVAVEGADPVLVAAARHGIVYTCVSRAQRLGLWVSASPDAPHVAAPAHAGHIRTRAKVHWGAPLIPRHPDDLEDPVENALVILAGCVPIEEAVIVWESALRRQLIDAHVLTRYALPPAARRVLERATPFSDSGLETILIQRLGWLNLPLLPQAWVLGHRVDLLIGDRLVIQIDGGHHVGAQRTSDIDHDARLTLRGYHVLRFSYEQIMERWHEVQAIIMAAIAQGLHLA
ncbi:endonuclease domain-containing protein [Microbacterium sp. GXF0217]